MEESLCKSKKKCIIEINWWSYFMKYKYTCDEGDSNMDSCSSEIVCFQEKAQFITQVNKSIKEYNGKVKI